MAKRKPCSLERKLSRCGYVFILPLIFGVCVIWLPNIVQAMVFTLNELKVLPGDYTLTWMGLEYFRRALTENAEFIPLLLSSLRSLASDIPVILIFSLFMAVLLNQNFRGRTFVRAVFFIPVVLVTGVVANTAYETGLNDILSSQNLGDAANQATQMTAGVESLLLSLNFGEGLLSFVSAAVTGISRVVQSSGVQIFLFLAALQEIPESLYEAARVEGCTAVPEGDGLLAEGRLGLTLLTKMGDGEYYSFDRTMELQRQLPGGEDCRWEAGLECRGCRWEQTGNELSLTCELVWQGAICRTRRLAVLEDITVDEAAPKENRMPRGLYIYMAEEGESLWEVARRYNTSEARIREDNGEMGECCPAGPLLIPV